MLDNHTTRVIAVASVAAASGAFVAGYVIPALNKRKKEIVEVPKKWIRVGEVSQLNVFPIKSCQGVPVNEVHATPIGTKVNDYLRDRIFAVVSSSGELRSQRQLPRLTLIGVSITDNQLTLSAPDTPEITITIPEYRKDLVRTCHYSIEQIQTSLDCGDEVAGWLSDFLNIPGLRLYFHQGETTQRAKMTSRHLKFPMFSSADKGTYHDLTSYMFMTEESLEKLNEHLETPLTVRSFRPVVLIKGIPEPFAEDFWSFVRIGAEGGPIFKAAAPCIRCKLTTVDPDKGEFSESGEPLKTLTKLKRSMGNEKVDKLCKNVAILGLHLGLFQPGNQIRVGDPVYAAVL